MMLAAFKALVVVFTMSLGAFIYARLAFGKIIDPRLIDRWRNIYLAVTIAAFLIPNYWLTLFVLALIVIALGAPLKDKAALYLLLLFAVPAAGELVPGFGAIRTFLYLYPFNILAVVILFPLLFRARETRAAGRVGALADFCFIGFSVVALMLAFRDTTVTDAFRRFTAYVLTAFGPYLVFSRMNWTKERLKIATLAYVIPLIALSGVAVVETVLHWHVFAAAVENWGVDFFYRYLARSGYLRAYASVFGPIAFGLFLVAAFALMLPVTTSAERKALPVLGLGAIGVALVATFSRGPWIGAALAVLMFAMTGARPIGNFIRVGAFGMVAAMAIAVSPLGDELIAMIPFIGGGDTGTIDYRQRLWAVAWPYAMTHPWFGSDDYLTAPAMQSLVQGQGIIDIVNSYLQVVLDKGLVGLSLFVGVSLFSLFSVLRAIKPARSVDPELASYAQGWFAALAGVMLTLATTTNVVAQIAEAHWLLCGMCVGIARSVRIAAAAGAPAPPADAPPEKPPPTAGELAPSAAVALPPHLRQYAPR